MATVTNTKPAKLRRLVYDYLENKNFDTALSRGIEYFLIALIVINVVAVIASSVNEWYSDYQIYFDGLEYFSIGVFSVEFLLRFWAVAEGNFDKNYAVTLNDKVVTHLESGDKKQQEEKVDENHKFDPNRQVATLSNITNITKFSYVPSALHQQGASVFLQKSSSTNDVQQNPSTDCQNRLAWLKKSSAIIDFIAIFPAFINFFAPIDLRFLIVLRVLRLFKLTRYFVALRILLKVIMRERESFKAVLFILVILIILSASGIYLVENKAQPSHFGSIPASMWWAVVTLTTVGYGDVTPITTTGKMLGALITILGVGLAALPAGILASGLANELNQRREMTELQFRTHVIEHELDFKEHVDDIEKIRQEIGLTQEQAQIVIKEIVKEQAMSASHANLPNFCPHCGHNLNKEN